MRYDNSMGATVWGELSPLHLWTPQTMVGVRPRLGCGLDRKLEVALNAGLFVDRRIAGLLVTVKGPDVVDLVFKNLAPFDMPRPGQYAWQREADGARRIQFRMSEALGAASAKAQLGRLLRQANTRSYARVTPEGVTVRVCGAGRAPGPLGYAPSRMFKRMMRQTAERSLGAHVGRRASACPHEPTRWPLFPKLRLEGVRCAFPTLINVDAAEEDRKEYPMTAPAGTRIVNCQFAGQGEGDKTYAYYTADQDIKVGDYAVAVSPFDGAFNSRGNHYEESLGGHPVVVEVVSVEETVESIERAAKWLVQRIDLADYAEKQAAQRRIEVLLAKAKRLEADARKRLELEKLRDLSPELGTVIDELKELGYAAPAAAAD